MTYVRLSSLIAILLLTVAPTLDAQLRWEPSERGLEGANVLAMHATPGGAILAATRIGFYRLERGAERWSYVYPTVVSATPLFASDADDVVQVVSDLRHLRSDDDGRSWGVVEASGEVVATAGDGDGGTIIIGDRGTSTDAGVSWTPGFPGTIEALVAIGPNRYFAHCREGVRLWSMSTRAWAPRPDLTGRQPLISLGGGVLIGGTLGYSSVGTNRSLDSGRRWFVGGPVINPISFARLDDGSVIMTSYSPGRTLPSDGLYRTVDSGDTWTRVATGGFDPITVSRDGDIWSRTVNGIVRSTDRGATWTLHGAGIHERRAEIRSDASGTFFAFAELSHLAFEPTTYSVRTLLSSRDGRAWRRKLDSVQYFQSLDSGWLVASTIGVRQIDGRGLVDFTTRVSTDGGDTWRSLAPWHFLRAARGSRGRAAIVVQPINSGDTNLLLTLDSGATWVRRAVPGYLTYVSFTDSVKIYVATAERPSRNAARRLLSSIDSGRTWKLVRDSVDMEGILTFNDSTIVVLRVHGSGGYAIDRSLDSGRTWDSTLVDARRLATMRLLDTAIVLVWHTDSGVFVDRSLDSGDTWSRARIDGLISVGSGPWISGNGEMFALRQEGMIRSRDHGMTWQLIDSEITWHGVASNASTIVAQHTWRSLWVAEDIPLSAPSASRPRVTSLAIRPNPASARLVVDVPAAGILTLIDLSGREVRRLTIDGTRDSAVLDVAGLAQGVYVVRMTSANGASTARVVIAGD